MSPKIALAFLVAWTIPALHAVLIPYAVTPGAEPSITYSLTVDGTPVIVERFRDISYARFAFSGTVFLHVGLKAANRPDLQISPLSYQLHAAPAADGYNFSLDRPRQLILHTGALAEKLFIFADGPEKDAPRRDDPGVTVFHGGKLQAAIDAVAAKGGGTLLVPNGKFFTGGFQLRSGVTLYLSSGALIQGTDKPSDYDRALVTFDHLHDARIAGRGVLAMAGTATKKVTTRKIRICNMADCQRCGIEYVILRDSGGFTVHILRSHDILMRGYKIVNDIVLPNQDGTDPDGSDGVIIDGVFMYTSDDAIAVKADTTPCRNVLVKNCVFWTKKSALKVGSDPYFGASDITFLNDDVVHADRALALYSGKGPITRVKFINDTSETVGGDAKRQLIVFQVSNAKQDERNAVRRGIGKISHVEITHYTAYESSERPSLIAGTTGRDGSKHEVSDVVFTHLVVAGRTCLSAADAGIEVKQEVEGLEFRP
jgi:hypothetical protein